MREKSEWVRFFGTFRFCWKQTFSLSFLFLSLYYFFSLFSSQSAVESGLLEVIIMDTSSNTSVVCFSPVSVRLLLCSHLSLTLCRAQPRGRLSHSLSSLTLEVSLRSPESDTILIPPLSIAVAPPMVSRCKLIHRPISKPVIQNKLLSLLATGEFILFVSSVCWIASRQQLKHTCALC